MICVYVLNSNKHAKLYLPSSKHISNLRYRAPEPPNKFFLISKTSDLYLDLQLHGQVWPLNLQNICFKSFRLTHLEFYLFIDHLNVSDGFEIW